VAVAALFEIADFADEFDRRMSPMGQILGLAHQEEIFLRALDDAGRRANHAGGRLIANAASRAGMPSSGNWPTLKTEAV
jgi:hypothetical protein